MLGSDPALVRLVRAIVPVLVRALVRALVLALVLVRARVLVLAPVLSPSLVLALVWGLSFLKWMPVRWQQWRRLCSHTQIPPPTSPSTAVNPFRC